LILEIMAIISAILFEISRDSSPYISIQETDLLEI
jgi:hypothetical protein